MQKETSTRFTQTRTNRRTVLLRKLHGSESLPRQGCQIGPYFPAQSGNPICCCCYYYSQGCQIGPYLPPNLATLFAAAAAATTTTTTTTARVASLGHISRPIWQPYLQHATDRGAR